MKRKIFAMLLCMTFVMTTAAGCGDKDEKEDNKTVSADNTETDDTSDTDDKNEETDKKSDTTEKNQETEKNEEPEITRDIFGPVELEKSEEKETDVTTKSSKKRATQEEIFSKLEGTWISSDTNFELCFYRGSSDNDYFVKLKGENGFEDKVSYLDETSVEENESKIRFVIGNGGVGSSREIILSAGGSKMSYITGIQKDDDKGFVDKTIECTKM